MAAKRGKRVNRKDRIKHLIKNHKAYCYYCKKRITRIDDFTIDHKIPISRGGNLLPNPNKNKVICCKACNNEKGDMTHREYMAFRKNKKEFRRIPEEERQIRNASEFITRALKYY